MGMDFGDGPDLDAIKEERQVAANKGTEKKEIPEEECWRHLYFFQKYKATEEDDGLREIFKNEKTGMFRMKKKVGKELRHPGRTNVEVDIWDWDGEAYSI